MKRKVTLLLKLVSLSLLINLFYLAAQPSSSTDDVSHSSKFQWKTKSNNNRDSESKSCHLNITLPFFDQSKSEKYQAFFLETSAKPYLNGRQVCSIESAVRNSDLTCKVILRSAYLDLSHNQSLCDLYYDYPNVEFYTIDYNELFRQYAFPFFFTRH